MKRIFQISNRVGQSGGLDEAICKAPEGYEVVRFGWSGKDPKKYDPDNPVSIEIRNGMTCILVDLNESDFHLYYEVIANSLLWPIFHSRPDVAQGYSKEAAKAYYKVNEMFAKYAKEHIRPDDVVWVHDYHLAPMIQHLDTGNPTGFFLHTPVMPTNSLQTLGRDEQNFMHEFLSNLHQYDCVGVQTKQDLANLAGLIGQRTVHQVPEYFETMPLTNHRNKRGTITQFGAFPVAGHIDEYTKVAQAQRHDKKVLDFIREKTPNDEVDIFGVARLDYSKNLVTAARAFGRSIFEDADNTQAHFLQIAPFGREGTLAYQLEKERVVTSFNDVNEMFGGWRTTLHMENVARPVHLGIAGHSNMTVILSLRDGFNLAATEYLAAQHGRDEPGIVIASKFMGVSEVYDQSILAVDPTRPDEIAHAIKSVRSMSGEQKRELLSIANETHARHTNLRWQSSMIKATEESHAQRKLEHFGLRVATNG